MLKPSKIKQVLWCSVYAYQLNKHEMLYSIYEIVKGSGNFSASAQNLFLWLDTAIP